MCSWSRPPRSFVLRGAPVRPPMAAREASVVAICHQPASSSCAARPATPHRQPEQDTRRRPERSPLYQIVAGYLETLLCERSLGEQPVAGHVEDELRGSLRCGILSFAFARPRGIRPPPQLPLRHRNGRHPLPHRLRSGLLEGIRTQCIPIRNASRAATGAADAADLPANRPDVGRLRRAACLRSRSRTASRTCRSGCCPRGCLRERRGRS